MGPVLRCSPDLGGPCDGEESQLAVTRLLAGGLAVEIRSTEAALGGYSLMLEVLRGDDGELAGRLCRGTWTDAVSYACGAASPVCATSGTIRIASFPDTQAEAAALPIMVSAVFPDGVTLEGTL